MHILIDLDDTIADWSGYFDSLLDAYDSKVPRKGDRVGFSLHEGCSPKESDLIDRLMNLPGFYASLKPLPGAIDGVLSIADAGHDVSIVTSPWLSNPTCVQDKIDWVREYLGSGWEDRIVITKDKTAVRGDFLIDDKPDIKGRYEPEWRQIIFDQPYNEYAQLGRLVLRDWDHAPEFVNELENVYVWRKGEAR